jgi:hypothetical protein
MQSWRVPFTIWRLMAAVALAAIFFWLLPVPDDVGGLTQTS